MGRAGLGRSLAQLTSLVQNPMGGGEGWWWVGRAPGTGSIPRPEVVPFSSSQTSDISMEGWGGGRGSHPFPPGTWAATVAGEAGPAWSRRGAQPSVPGSLKGLPLLPELLH